MSRPQLAHEGLAGDAPLATHGTAPMSRAVKTSIHRRTARLAQMRLPAGALRIDRRVIFELSFDIPFVGTATATVGKNCFALGCRVDAIVEWEDVYLIVPRTGDMAWLVPRDAVRHIDPPA